MDEVPALVAKRPEPVPRVVVGYGGHEPERCSHRVVDAESLQKERVHGEVERVPRRADDDEARELVAHRGAGTCCAKRRGSSSSPSRSGATPWPGLSTSSSTRYSGRPFASSKMRAMYWPTTPSESSWTPPSRSMTTITEVQPLTCSSVKNLW